MIIKKKIILSFEKYVFLGIELSSDFSEGLPAQLSKKCNQLSSLGPAYFFHSSAQLSYFFERPAERCTNKHYHNYLTLVRQLSNPSSYEMQIS
jgi:hypothetical protein